MAGRMTQFSGVAVMAGRCRPDSGDGRADGAVPGHSGDDGGRSQGSGDVVPGVAEEEQGNNNKGGVGRLSYRAWR
jgi:hypothetical protein